MKRILVVLIALCACLGPATTDAPSIALGSDQAVAGQLTVMLEPHGPSVTRTVTIYNNSTCVLSFTSAVEDTWMSAAPATGTIDANGTAVVTVTINSSDSTGALVPGIFLGTLDITATCQATGKAVIGSPAAVAITVVVAPVDAGTIKVDGGTLDGGTLDSGVK